MLPLTRSRHRARFFGDASTLEFDFISASALDSRITFTRASSATRFNSSGVLETVGNDVPRLDFNPATLAAQGLLIEEQRTNSIRNNTMVGAVAGTPGTVPTNWLASTPSNGLNRQVVGAGTENGIAYLDVRYSGTTSAASLTAIYWESATQVAAASGQTWTNSVYVALVGGSTANTTGVVVGIDENNGAGGFLTGSSTTFVPSAGGLSGKRVSHTRTLTNASTAFVWTYMFFSYGNGAAIDITLRIGLPQLEQGAFATSVIPTTTTALTRSADVASVNTLTPWFNAAQGTLFVEVVGLMPNTLSGNRAFASLSDNTYNNSISLMKGSGISEWRNEIYSSGSVQASFVFATYIQSAAAKLAIAYQANDANSAVNGTVSTTDTTVTVPTVNKLELRDPTGASGGQPTCYIRRLAYYPRPFAGAQLQALTA